MAKSKFPITYAFGRRDRVDPKLAPLGVLAVGQNLRMRKDGRLGMRNGYQPLEMTTRNGTLVAYDVHEYRDRLIALGSDSGDGFPTDLFEYTGLPDAAWCATDRLEQRVMLNPLTNLREVAGIPQPSSGVTLADAAIGDGYVCLVYKTDGLSRTYALVVDAETDQVVHQEELTSSDGMFAGNASRVRVVYVGGTFFVGAVTSGGAIKIARFTVGASSRFGDHSDPVASGGAITAFDLCAVSNPANARVVVAYDRSGSDLTVKVYSAGGTLLNTIAVATDAVDLAIEADQGHDSINLLTVTPTTFEVHLRTFDFTGALLDGPTDFQEGETVFLCRVPAQDGFAEHVAVVVNVTDEPPQVDVSFVEVAGHATTDDASLLRAHCTGRPLAAPCAAQPMAVLLPTLVGPDLTTFERATNALFYLSPDVHHMATRDYTRARDSLFMGLSRDATTGKVCWPAMRDPGIDVAMPVVTLTDFQSAARRQSAQYGGLLYFAGAAPTVYDGRINGELGFAELPGILSATGDADPEGFLATDARYSYVYHWEFVLADGSVQQGPVTAPFEAATGAGENSLLIVITSPHSIRLAAGDALFGANITGVLSRTEWDPVTRTAGSTYRRCLTRHLPSGGGRNVTVRDVMSDVELGVQDAIYTQAARGALSGPLEHNAPRPCSYITATEARLLTGGLPRECDVQISKAAFYGEPFSFSEASPFFGLASGSVIGVQSLDQARLIFTRNRILSLAGVGPDDIGGSALEPPVEIPTPSGLSNPWSFLEAPDGLWFQLDDTKLFRMPRGGGAPEWVGVDIEDTLLAFPSITGTAKHRRDNAAVFACNAGSTARFVVRDFRTENWLVDVPPLRVSGGGEPLAGVEALCSTGETLAYVSGGVVFTQTEAAFSDIDTNGDPLFVETIWRTHPLYPFGLGGYGLIPEMLVTGEFRGASSLRTLISYDDGQTFTEQERFDFVAPDYVAAGQTFQRRFPLLRDTTSTLVVEFRVVTQQETAPPNPSEGLIINQLDLLVEPEAGLRALSSEHTA